MENKILVAGGTGTLGGKIINALLERGAAVRMIVRSESNGEKMKVFQDRGVEVIKLNMQDKVELAKACENISCVISALAGLRDVIVDTQKVLLDAAVDAGVPRFIPSDYSLNFTKLAAGENRNFDLRREFHQYLNEAAISSTSIFNGAFADILSYNTPMLDFKKQLAGYWGADANWHLDFTTMDDTAAYTAAAAIDSSTPSQLNIAGFQISPNEIATIAAELTGQTYKATRMGSLADFANYNKTERAAHPEAENELYPKWQNGQYMHDMFSTHHETLDNDRYPGIAWTGAKEFISSILRRG